jgi:hypothetical protein
MSAWTGERPMRELHGYHGEHRRHARDAAAPADTHGRHARDRAHEAPKHASHDAPKFKILRDPEARKAEHLKYQQKVEAAEAEYAARHAKPKPGDQSRAPERLKPQEAIPEHAPPESRDKPSSRIASRDLPEHKEAAWKGKKERSWLPSNETSQVVVSADALFTAINASYHIVPGKVDGIAAAALGLVVAGVAWANKRWKDKHGDRPEG